LEYFYRLYATGSSSRPAWKCYILCSLVCRCITVIWLGLLSEVAVFKAIFIDDVAVAHLVVQGLGLYRISTYLMLFVLQIRFYLYQTYIKKLYMIMFIHHMILLRRVVQPLCFHIESAMSSAL